MDGKKHFLAVAIKIGGAVNWVEIGREEIVLPPFTPKLSTDLWQLDGQNLYRLEGNLQVGSVEVLCVGPVAVGDLLTTSSVPGYAMAVRKPLKGIGAAIGKATTTLKKGERGLVEMQVEKH
jgi:hypothetical protein